MVPPRFITIFDTAAGFTEHDTLQKYQFVEGQMSRGEALRRVREENKPRYQNMRWYLDTVGLDFPETVKVINEMPKDLAEQSVAQILEKFLCSVT